MKSILKFIFLTVIIIVLFDITASYLFTTFIFNKTLSGESGGTINYALKNTKKDDFIIIGASVAKHNINPALLSSLGKNGYNLGINGVNVINNLLVIDILFSHEVVPKIIVLQTVLPDYTKETNTRDSELNQIKRVYPYNTTRIRDYVKSLGLSEQLRYYSGLYRLNRKIINISYNYLKKNRVNTNNGYIALPKGDGNLDDVSDQPVYTYDQNSSSRKALSEIKKLTDQNNVKLIIVLPPSYKNVFTDLNQNDLFIKDLQEHGFTYIADMSDYYKYPTLLSKDNWRDTHHLNEKGSAEFSRLLNKEISVLLKKNGK